MPKIEIKNLIVEYKSRAGAIRVLDNLDATFESGKFNSILGYTGSGKTTLLRTIIGLLPYEGAIFIAKTIDFAKFKMIPTGFLPFNRNGVMFPEKINGNFMMLSRPSDSGNTPFGNIYISESNDLIHWGNHKLLMKNFHLGDNFWERIKIGAGPAPIKTEKGWLLIYHGVQATCNGLNYSIGVALLDLKDPTKVLKRADRYILSAEKDYERVGFTTNVCFPCSALVNSKGEVTIYYGVADTNLAIAFTTIDKLLSFVEKYNRD